MIDERERLATEIGKMASEAGFDSLVLTRDEESGPRIRVTREGLKLRVQMQMRISEIGETERCGLIAFALAKGIQGPAAVGIRRWRRWIGREGSQKNAEWVQCLVPWGLK